MTLVLRNYFSSWMNSDFAILGGTCFDVKIRALRALHLPEGINSPVSLNFHLQ